MSFLLFVRVSVNVSDIYTADDRSVFYRRWASCPSRLLDPNHDSVRHALCFAATQGNIFRGSFVFASELAQNERIPLWSPKCCQRGSQARNAARGRQKPIEAKDLKGLTYFKCLASLLNRLDDDATARSGRQPFPARRDSTTIMPVCSCCPSSCPSSIPSSRVCAASSRQANSRKCNPGAPGFGCGRVSRGSLSEASRVFDPELLHEIIGQVATRAISLVDGREAEALRGLTVPACRESLLPALPKMAWALWLDPQHRAAKMHVHFDVLKGVPIEATVTTGNASETEQLRATLQASRLYVIDRGNADYQLFQDIIDAHSDFIGRIHDNAVWNVVEERSLTAEAKTAGVRSDRIVWLGCPKSGSVFKQLLRVVEVDTGRTDAKGRPDILLLATNRLDLAAELIGLGYRFRWTIELFFRWLKCILSCRSRRAGTGQQPRRRRHPSLLGHHRQFADHSLGGTQTNPSHPGNAAVLLHRLGDRRRTDGPSREIQKTRSISRATGARRDHRKHSQRQHRTFGSRHFPVWHTTDQLRSTMRALSLSPLRNQSPSAMIVPDTIVPVPLFRFQWLRPHK